MYYIEKILQLMNPYMRILTLAALINSSATHSAMVLIFLNAASRAPVQRSQIA